MKTSNFARAAKLSGAISIARGTPTWFRGQRCEALAPSWPLVGWAKAYIRPGDRNTVACREYERRYRAEVLDRLDPANVAEELQLLVAPHEPILLCWEAPGAFCHRRLVAQWLQEALGEVVPEMEAR